MSLSKKQISHLIKVIESVQMVLQEAMRAPAPSKVAGKARGAKRIRRTGTDLVDFKKAIKKERKDGASVAELAEKYGVTPSYLYQLRD